MSNRRDALILEAMPHELRLCHARLAGASVEFSESCSFPSGRRADDKAAIEDQIVLDAVSARLCERDCDVKDLICLVGGQAISCHYFDMPSMTGASLRQAVLLKLGQQLHFDIGEAIVDVQTIGPAAADNPSQIRVSATAVRRSVADCVVEAASRLGLNLVAMSAKPVALMLLAQEVYEDGDGLRAVLDVGERLSTLIVLNGNKPCLACELELGKGDFTSALMRPIISGDDVIQLDEQRAAAICDEVGIPQADQKIESLGVEGHRLLPLIEPVLQKLAQQLTQWLTFVSTSADAGEVAELHVVGAGAAMPGLIQAIDGRIGPDVRACERLQERVTISGDASRWPADRFLAAAGAVRHERKLPDLIPPEVHRERKIRRVRRSTALVSPIVAAAIFGFAFLFDQVATKIQPALGAHQTRLADVQRLVGRNDQWYAEQKIVDRLQGEFDSFSRATPCWVGLFKELSRILPSNLKATLFTAKSGENGNRVRVDAKVYTTVRGRALDEVVEQVLLSLERSPFVRQVQLLNSTRTEQNQDHPETGTLSVELGLSYFQPKKGA